MISSGTTLSVKLDGTYRKRVRLSDHKNVEGEYNVHLYYVQNDGSLVGVNGTKTTISIENQKFKAKSVFRIATAKLAILILWFQISYRQAASRMFPYQLGQRPMVKMISSGTMQNVRLTVLIGNEFA